MNVDIINPCTYPTWDSLLETNDQTTFFHTTAWAKVLSESYCYKPLYFTIIENDKLIGLIPVMEIDSWLTGKRGVSLPFTDICHPIADSTDTFQELLNCAKEYGRRAGWKYIELRGGRGFLDNVPPSAEHITHLLSLNGDEAKLNGSFRDSTRRNIQKADREGVRITIGHTRESLEAFYGLHCQTRKYHGLPPQPWSFFEKIHEQIITPQKGFLVLADYQAKTVAGAVFFNFRSEAIFKFGASNRNHLGHRPNNLIMWEAIRWSCNNGIRSFHFGRTEPENEGLLQFKDGWGAPKAGLRYYKYDLAKDCFKSDTADLKSAYSIFKLLPLPILRMTGNLLYRHVG